MFPFGFLFLPAADASDSLNSHPVQLYMQKKVFFFLCSESKKLTELGSLVVRTGGSPLNLGSTTELRASPGRAELGLTLVLVRAVCGRGHSIG